MIANKVNEIKLKKYFEIDSNGDLDLEIDGMVNELKNKIILKLPEQKILKFKVKYT